MSIHVSANLYTWLRADAITWIGLDPWAHATPGDWVDATDGDVIPIHLPAGRDIAARALYRQITGTMWAEASAPSWYLAYRVGINAAWSLQGNTFAAQEGLIAGQPYTSVPGLSALDPFDGTTLPEGGRTVDADALRLALLVV